MSTATNRCDLSDLEFWKKPPADRLEHFRRLRDEDPVSWHGRAEPGGDDGFWALVRYDDVRTVSRDPETYSSAKGVVVLDEDPTEAALGVQSFLVMDDPGHKRLRGLVQQAFTPRHVALLEQRIAADARAIIDRLEAHETGNFVDAVSKRLPSITICRMLGVPDADREQILEHVDAMVACQDPEFLQGRDMMEVATEAAMGIGMYAYQMAQHRREHPSDDLISALVEAEEDGVRLNDAEIAQFLLLLAVAGNDTTRNTTSHAAKALTDWPQERAILLADPSERLPIAVEEFVRWASPVMHFKRTATHTAELGGRAIQAGDEVVMIYSSANRDERVFAEPNRFDVTRSPNRHVGFGGGGPHFCMGAVLARTQLRALFAELLRAFPDFHVGDPTYVVGNFMNAIRELPMDTGRRAG